MKNIIIGTAGHIDHGKTALIKALTGRNTDRWKEEQERGITIDLGFTWLDLPGGNRAGIVDVPGHEKFIPNMVAGVVGMDMVMLVIAADEGIMPQTREHMDILRLLGIEKSIVVLNKCDLVDEDWLELMEEEIKEELQGTFLENAPCVKVSSITGQGLEELVDTIVRVSNQEVVPKEINTIPRLPIDRVFSISGFGTVVSGTLVSGKISKEDTLEIYPTGKLCKIRNIQVHGKDAQVGYAGQRVALNLANIKKKEAKRGCTIAPMASMRETDLLDVRLNMLEASNYTLGNRDRLHLFTGTSEVLCRAVLLDHQELAPGESGYVQLRLEEKVAVRKGDRFVVRFYSPMETIGGGVILEPNPRIKKRFKEAAINELKQKEQGSTADVIALHVKSYENTMITASELAKITARSLNEVLSDIEKLEKEGIVKCFQMKKELYVWHMDAWMNGVTLLTRKMTLSQEKHPYRMGIKKAETQMTWFKKIKATVFDQVIAQMEKENILKRVDEFLCTPDHTIKVDKQYLFVRKKLMTAMKKAQYEFINYKDVACGTATPDVIDDVLEALRRDHTLVKLADQIYTVYTLIDDAKNQIVEYLKENEVITFGEVRDMFHTSRKNAKLILEFTDSERITKKVGAETERVAFDNNITLVDD